MTLPETLGRVKAELATRAAAGLSFRIVDFDAEPFRDDSLGLFMRFTFKLDDGDTFTVDTQEASELLGRVDTH